MSEGNSSHEDVNHQQSQAPELRASRRLPKAQPSMLLTRFSAAGARVMGGTVAVPCPRVSFHLSRMFSIERRGGALAMSGRKDQSLIGKAGEISHRG